MALPLEFFVELVPGGRMSAHFAALRLGMALGVGAVKAGLRLDGRRQRALMLATVTGVNPFVSILRDAARAVLERFALTPSDTTAYACGNPGMIEAAQGVLGGLGFTVRTESYG